MTTDPAAEAQRAYDQADHAVSSERTIFNDTIKLATFAAPRITASIVRASHLSKPRKARSDELDLAIAFAADLLEKLTQTRTRLGWHRGRDAS